MKTLFLSSMYYRKAGATFAGAAIHRQAIELQRRGIEVRVVCPVPRFRRESLGPSNRAEAGNHLRVRGTVEVDGVAITYLSYPNVPLGVSPAAHVALLDMYVTRCVDQLRQVFPFDLIHSHHLFPMGYVGLRIARRHGVPNIASAVGSDVHTHPLRNRGIRERTRTTIGQSDVVLAVSHALAQRVEQLSEPRQPVYVVHRGVDVDQFSPGRPTWELRNRLGVPTEGIGICSVGRLIRGKGVMELLDAFTKLGCGTNAAWLALVGDGPMRNDLLAKIRTRDLSDRVFLVGTCPHSEVPRWLNAADIFVLSSYNEGLPNVVLEAMACGKPVVATEVGGVAEAVEDGISGILVPAGSVECLTGALDRLVGSSELRRAMGVAGRDRVCSNFSWTRAARELHSIYRDLLNKYPSSISISSEVEDRAV